MKRKSEAKSAGGIGDAAVRAKTGKGWQQWFTILDRAGAPNMSHAEIAAYLHKRLGLSGWWSQMVTVGYEQERGLREKHQKPSGYEISSSKTVAVSLATLYGAWQQERLRKRWLGATGLLIRKATSNKSMRITWTDGQTSLAVNFYSRGSGKSQVAVQHAKLADANAAERMKAYRAEALERLKKTLEA